MGVFESSTPQPGISRCRYFVCPKCNALYNKETVLSSWRAMFFFSGSSQAMVSGTRACKCGNVMEVNDIYKGVLDLPKQHWDKVQGPVEIE